MKTRTSTLTAALAAGSVMALAPAVHAESKDIATVVKIAGIQWFNRMEEGVRKFAEETGNHNQWVDGAITYQQENYPDMTLVGDKNETFDDAENAYAKAQEVLRAFPKITGMQGSASTDVAGIGRAIEERGKEDETCVFGTSLPSIAGQYLETGAVDGIGFWDPAVAGEAMNKLAMMVINDQEVTDGMNLGLAGYEQVTLDGKVIYGQAWVNVNQDNMADYPF